MVEQTVGDPRASLRIQPQFQQILDNSLAKPARDWRTGQPATSQSYFEHVTDVYWVWNQLVELHRHAIERVATRACIPTERFLKSSLLCVALHDVGKLTGNFLDMIEATSKSSYRRAQSRNYRHEIAALPLVSACARALQVKEGPVLGNGNLEVLAVAGHHRFLAEDYLFSQEKFSNEISWRPDVVTAIQAAFLLAQKMFRDHGWRLPNVSNFEFDNLSANDEETNFPFMELIRARNLCCESTNKQRFREVFALLKGLLMVSDWRASAAIEQSDVLDAQAGCVNIPSESLKLFIKQKVEFEGKQFNDYRQFQKDCGAAPSHVLAIAPTGSGKTEAAFLWALNQIEQGHARKVLFLLPTMITANSLHARAVDFFEKRHEHKVGLIHSTADLVRQDIDINTDHAVDNAHLQGNVLAERHFFYPVTVGTVDQLLNTLFHSGKWAMKTFAAMDAAIVIDEVHAYDPHTAGLISLMLEQLSAAGTRFMVMSATMPRDLRMVISDSLAKTRESTVTIVADQELLQSSRNNWETRDQPLSQWLLQDNRDQRYCLTADASAFLSRESDSGTKVLIVVNTVRRCQDIAGAIRERFPSAVCYHSKFIFNDRRRLEKLITSADSPVNILVATQVVEVSLDIDFDLLLTECAPIDALVQRAGRVNRARREQLGRIVVHPPEEFSDKLYGEPSGVLEKSWEAIQANPGTLSESDLLNLVEQVYEGNDLSRNDAFLQIKAQTEQEQIRLAGVLDSPRPEEDNNSLVTRLIEYEQTSVIPSPYKTTVMTCNPKDRRRYELKVPVWYAKDQGKFEPEINARICQMSYDDFLGGKLLSSKLQDGTRVDEPGFFII